MWSEITNESTNHIKFHILMRLMEIHFISFHQNFQALTVIIYSTIIPCFITNQSIIKTVCEPIENKQSPTCAYEAQFSVPYLIAVALARHDFSLADLEPEPLADPVVANLAKKVNYEIDPDSGFPTYYSGEVHIKLTDGRLLKHREYKNRGCFDRPLSAEDITNKFNLNCQLAVSEEVSDNIKKAILGLTSFSSVTELTRHL